VKVRNILDALAWIAATPGVSVRELPNGKYQVFMAAGLDPDPNVPGATLDEHPIGLTRSSWTEAVADAAGRREV
jgi:hypothetical protein